MGGEPWEVPGWPAHNHKAGKAKYPLQTQYERLSLFGYSTFGARYESICRSCSLPILKGAQVAWRKGEAAHHLECAFKITAPDVVDILQSLASTTGG